MILFAFSVGCQAVTVLLVPDQSNQALSCIVLSRFLSKMIPLTTFFLHSPTHHGRGMTNLEGTKNKPLPESDDDTAEMMVWSKYLKGKLTPHKIHRLRIKGEVPSTLKDPLIKQSVSWPKTYVYLASPTISNYKSFIQQASQRTLPSSHRIWCTTNVLQSLRGVVLKAQLPHPPRCPCSSLQFAFLEQAPSFGGLLLNQGTQADDFLGYC